ncbi:MAG: bifunctional nicotinamidase/pyrazinamidase [Bacteriovoracaceae bacterium]
MKTLIIIDVQNDFLPGGQLAVPHSEGIVNIINRIQSKFDLILATQDWHPLNHQSFASNHSEKKVFDKIMLHGLEQILWPNHCVQNTEGANFPKELQTSRIEAIFRKGTDPEIDSYSAFYDNGHRKSTGLSGYLKEKKFTELYFCGLAADVCVYSTITDAVAEGFECYLIEDATAPLDLHHYQELKQKMERMNVRIINSSSI